MIGRTFGIIAGDVLARKGVDLRADAVERVGDLEGGALFRALELHMLDKVRNAVLRVRFRGRTRADENAHRNGQKSLHLFDDEPKPV